MPALHLKQVHFPCLKRLFQLGLKTPCLPHLFCKRTSIFPIPLSPLVFYRTLGRVRLHLPMDLKRSHTQRRLQFFVHLYHKKFWAVCVGKDSKDVTTNRKKYKYRSDSFIWKSGRQNRFWIQYAGRGEEVLNVTGEAMLFLCMTKRGIVMEWIYRVHPFTTHFPSIEYRKAENSCPS